ncbi:hypothetical protein R6Q57_006489 [Mikania cordata]
MLVRIKRKCYDYRVSIIAAAVHSGEKTMQYGESIDDGENTHGQLPRLLDIVLYLCENEHIEGEMIFQLLEDLTEMSTMKNCENVFGYIETRTVCKGKARDVKDLQSTSSSSVKVVRFESSIGNRAKSKRGVGRTNEKNE